MRLSSLRILFLVAHPIDDASARYRVHQFLPDLESAGHACSVWSFSTERLFRGLRSQGQWGAKVFETLRCSLRQILRLADLSHFDLIVIHREAFPFLTPLIEKWVLLRHPKVVFSFDDAIYAGHNDVSGLNHPILYRLKYGRGVDEVLRSSLHVIAGNRILADYARQFNPRVSIVPTVVDCVQYPSKPARTNGNRPITVGWVGSRSTAPYLTAIKPALRSLAQANRGKVRFRFFGCPEYKLDVPDFESLPFRLETEVSDLHSIDIGIMPLPDTEWTRGKCAFKAIQYMASGIAAVASPVGITPEIIRHECNGLLAESADDWFRLLTRLVNDEELRRRLSGNARRTIEESYSLQVWGPRLVSLLDGLAGPTVALSGAPAAEQDYPSKSSQHLCKDH
jgi:glycosyltransferase involved in cell wall biosynthesis